MSNHLNVPGEQLFHEITEMYIWYISSAWYVPSEDVSSAKDLCRKCFSHLKRIAEVSFSGGSYLSFQDEQCLIDLLREAFQNLQDGKLSKQKLSSTLQSILGRCIHLHPKAQLVFKITELEYRFCIVPPPHQSEELTEKCQTILAKISHAVRSPLPTISVKAWIQGLGQILERDPLLEPIDTALLNAVSYGFKNL